MKKILKVSIIIILLLEITFLPLLHQTLPTKICYFSLYDNIDMDIAEKQCTLQYTLIDMLGYRKN